MPMLLRELGKTGVMVPVIGLGCMGMSEFYGSSNEVDNINVLNRSIELKCNLWDTSDVYGNGHNEMLLSKVLKDRRHDVFLCTKFGIIRSPDGQITGINGTPNYVREACEKSLKRLGVDYIDLYYQHRVDPNTHLYVLHISPIEDTVTAMAELVRDGKVKYLGLSECSAEILRRAHKVHPISALQGKYSSTNDFEKGDVRISHSRFAGENFDKNLVLVNKFNDLAKKKGIPLSQLCLAWNLAQSDKIVTIPGTKKIKYLEENVGAADIQLSADELSEIRKVIDSVEIVGYRQLSRKLLNLGNK
ncbi:7706_t:CDS:2 [Gigaspora margarita]|uniref:7706_t:CDS:1 n=1 Tax=Gigaspora margarita TaxID=4874 RepID=A0ABN7UXQ9_GIGMA|nr:7706_t:CDS:2 [Gigaspora margarita]